MGQGYFYSTQERIFFQNLLLMYDKPFAAIFIDGFNDFIQQINSNNNFTEQSIISISIAKSFEKKSKIKILKNWFKKRFVHLNLVRLFNEKMNRDKKEKFIEFDEKKKALYDKFGFQQDGLLRQNYWYDGKWWDSRILSVLNTDYNNKKIV